MHDSWIKSLATRLLAPALLACAVGSAQAADDDTIKVGVLHSLSGTMAISETTLKDTVLMLIKEQNAQGSLLGKQLEPVVVDPGSNWPLFAEKARQLLTQDEVDVIFGTLLRYPASPYCRWSRNSTACCSTRFSTRARNLRATSSTPAPHRISKRFQPSTI